MSHVIYLSYVCYMSYLRYMSYVSYMCYKLYELRKLYEYFVNHLKSLEIALNYLNCVKYNIFVSQNFE